jgi:hypothetical protein
MILNDCQAECNLDMIHFSFLLEPGEEMGIEDMTAADAPAFIDVERCGWTQLSLANAPERMEVA